MRNKVSPGQYLALLSAKYEVDPDEFFRALMSAEEKRESRCGNLSVERRGKTRDKAVFLISRNSRVVAQFPIPTAFLLEHHNPIKDFMQTDKIRRCIAKKNRGMRFLPIRDLHAGMKQVSLKARVLEIPNPRVVVTRFGNNANVASALIADETGTIKLCLWNEQIKSIATGDTIQVENARMFSFRGEIQLSIGRKGTLSNIRDVDSQLEVVQRP